MPGTELELMLGAVAWRLRGSADDDALTAEALRDIARDAALALEQLRPEVAALLRARRPQADHAFFNPFTDQASGGRLARR